LTLAAGDGNRREVGHGAGFDHDLLRRQRIHHRFVHFGGGGDADQLRRRPAA